MSISTNIDGTVGGANQLLDLLSVVSNPGVYEAKLKALQDATAQNQKLVELAGPASDILTLRDKLRVQNEEAASALSDAKAEAADKVAKAKKLADTIVNDATSKAQEILASATSKEDEAKAALVELNAKLAEANKLSAAAEKLKADLAKRVDEVKAEKAVSTEAKNSYEAAKAELIAKHKAFIESL